MVRIDGFSNESLGSYGHDIDLEKESIKYQVDLITNTFISNQDTLSTKLCNFIQITFSKIGHIFLNIFSLGKHQAMLDQLAFDEAVKEDNKQEIERLLEKSSIKVSEDQVFYLYDQNKLSFDSLSWKKFDLNTKLDNFINRLFTSFEKEPTSQKLTRLLNLRDFWRYDSYIIKIQEVFAKDNFKNLTEKDFEDFLTGSFFYSKSREFIIDFFKGVIEKKQYKFIEIALNHSLFDSLLEYILLTPGLDRIEMLEAIRGMDLSRFQKLDHGRKDIHFINSLLLSKTFSQLESSEQKQIFQFLKNNEILPPIQNLYYIAIYSGNTAAEETFNKFFSYQDYEHQTVNFFHIYKQYTGCTNYGWESTYKDILLNYISPVIVNLPKGPKRLGQLQDLTPVYFLEAIKTPALLKKRLQGM